MNTRRKEGKEGGKEGGERERERKGRREGRNEEGRLGKKEGNWDGRKLEISFGDYCQHNYSPTSSMMQNDYSNN